MDDVRQVCMDGVTQFRVDDVRSLWMVSAVVKLVWMMSYRVVWMASG